MGDGGGVYGVSGSGSRPTRLFCTKCGASLHPGAAFCTRCGTMIAAPTLAAAAGAEGVAVPRPPGFVADATSVAAQVRDAYGMTSAAAGLAAGLPWQVIGGDEPFDPRGFALAVAPAAQQAVRGSLRSPGVALLVTSTLDLAVAVLTGGVAALLPALGRAALAGATSLLALLTGSKSGPLRSLTGVFGALTAVVQLAATGTALYGGIRGGTPWPALLPGAIAMLSTLAMAVKTTVTAFRGRS